MKTCFMIPWVLLTAAVLAVDEPLSPAGSAETLQDPGIESSSTPVPEEWLDDYFGARPSSYLTDPQRLLPPPDFRERLAFLNYHADDSGIDLYVFVFGADQEIPARLRAAGLAGHQHADGKPAVLLYYYCDAPERSEVWLPPLLEEKLPASERRLLLESPAIAAGKESDPARQFETFLVQMSIRLYWLETLLGRHEASDGGHMTSKPMVREAPAKPGFREFINPWLDAARPYVPHALAVLMIVSVGIAAIWWVKRRARFRFPDFEVEPRLGGSHAAGVGAVISFASASVPPATQRDAMPDYLRRAR